MNLKRNVLGHVCLGSSWCAGMALNINDLEEEGRCSRLPWFILMRMAWLLICNEFEEEGVWSRLLRFILMCTT